jgi:hypothetical protein
VQPQFGLRSSVALPLTGFVIDRRFCSVNASKSRSSKRRVFTAFHKGRVLFVRHEFEGLCERTWNYLKLSWKSTTYMSSSSLHDEWQNSTTQGTKITKIGHQRTRPTLASQALPQPARHFLTDIG